jgi:cyanate permease
MVVTASHFIAVDGWRFTYRLLALLVVAIAIPVTVLFLHEPMSAANEAKPETLSGEPSAGGSVHQALLSTDFWLTVLVTILVCTTVNALVAHFVAWSGERGVSLRSATFALSAFSLGSPIGTVVSGAVADRANGPRPLAFFYGLPLVGLAMLLLLGPAALIPSMVLLGAGFGAASGLLPFLVTRYFGVEHAAQLIGIGIGIFVLLLGVGPVILGYAHDHFRSFSPADPVLLAVLAAAIVASLSLRQYRVRPYSERMVNPAAGE